MYAASVARNRLFTAAFSTYQIRRLSHTTRWSSALAIDNRRGTHATEDTHHWPGQAKDQEIDPGLNRLRALSFHQTYRSVPRAVVGGHIREVRPRSRCPALHGTGLPASLTHQ